MRLRNVKGSREVIAVNEYVVRNEEKMSPDVKEFTVKWKRQIFEERM